MDYLITLTENPVVWRSALVLCILLSGAIVSAVLRSQLESFFGTASTKLRIEPTRYRFFLNGVSIAVWTVAIAGIVFVIPQLRAFAVTIFAGAGILVAVVGFAGQQALTNIVSGIFIVIFQPYRVGDFIHIGTQYMGTVDDITLRHTVITNLENRKIIVPNSTMSTDTIVNSTIEDRKICELIDIGISYDSDVDLAMELLQKIADAHPLCIDTRTAKQRSEGKPKVQVRLVSFGDSSVNLRAWAWANDYKQARELRWDVNKLLKQAFEKNGIQIPFPHRTIVMKPSPAAEVSDDS